MLYALDLDIQDFWIFFFLKKSESLDCHSSTVTDYILYSQAHISSLHCSLGTCIPMSQGRGSE